MDFSTGMLKNRNYIFFTILGLLLVLMLFCWQRASIQKARIIEDRLLYSQSVKAYGSGDYETARDKLLQTSLVFKQEWSYYYILGTVYLQLGQYEESEASFQQAETLSPMILTQSEYLTRHGQLYIFTGQKDEALAYLHQSSQLAKTDQERQTIQGLIDQARILP